MNNAHNTDPTADAKLTLSIIDGLIEKGHMRFERDGKVARLVMSKDGSIFVETGSDFDATHMRDCDLKVILWHMA